MYRFALTLIVALSLTAFCASAQQILPRSFAGWTQNGDEAFTPPAASSTNSAAPGEARDEVSAAREYGFAGGEHAAYLQSSETLDVTLYKMKDPTGAYGEYSYQRTPGMQRGDLAEHSAIASDRAIILTGNLVLDIHGANVTGRAADLKALVAAVGRHAQDGQFPVLWEHLPQKNVIEGTDRYILGPRTLDELFPGGLGDSIGFSTGAEAELAHYRVGGHDATLLIVDFPTPQLAQDRLADVEKKFNVNGSNPGSNSPALFATRSLTLLAIVAGPSSQTEASTVLDQVQSGTVLTWNEPAFQFKEPTIENMIVGAIVGTGVICLFSIIAGLAFGGIRLVVKRTMPGKIFDRASQLQVLQLGLASKPINADDFYATPSAPTAQTKVDKDLPDRIALRIFR
jgi:hypothetical protein